MSKRSDIRKLAMQLLYQIDVNGPDQIESIGQGLGDTLPPNIEPLGKPAFELAKDAWKNHKQADQLIAKLAPEWPTYRQPPVDRAILRLAYHEMLSGHAPAAVAINEAIELAKNFGSENSPAFINGVLDKVLKQLDSEGRLPTAEAPNDAPATPATPTAPTVKPADTGSGEPTEPEDSPNGPDGSNGSDGSSGSDGQATRKVEPQMPDPS